MFDTGMIRASGCWPWEQVRWRGRLVFSMFFKIGICCVFSLEPPHFEVILMSTHNMPLSICKRESP